MYQTIVQAVLAHGAQTPDRMAIGCEQNRITYAQLCGQVKCMAAKLAEEYEAEKGDFIMLQGVSRPDYVVAWLAIQYLGAVSIPTDKIAKEENILDVYRYSQAKFLLTDAPVEAEDVKCISLQECYEDAVKAAASGHVPELPYTAPEKSAVSEILFTTGTTGKPKGTMLTIGNIYAIIHNMQQGIGIQEDERILIPLPLNHSLGMRSLRAGLYLGGSVVLQEGFAFAKTISDNISEFQCTAMVCVPTSMELMYRQMRRHFSKIMGQLRYIEVGAGSLGYDMKKKLSAELPDTRVVNTWGSTESGGAIFLNLSLHQEKLTALGKPLDSVEVKIVDKEGNDITGTARDIDTAGRMILRGDMQMAGYFRMPEATAETLVNGWLYTNDIVYMDEDGFVYMLGRADDIINVGGEKVSPIEVENIAQEFEEIRECACIGVKDESLGQIPALFVVPEQGEFHQAQLLRFMADRVEKYKLPQRFVLLDALPRNRMQKLNRRELHRIWQEDQEK
ncbi:MAG: class I adenylate-forming enzyme family protein [Lachnospiraceae bacterium]|nr:class I adenylate-forming enzyme family protein [Lachnospiraceae bacterium]